MKIELKLSFRLSRDRNDTTEPEEYTSAASTTDARLDLSESDSYDTEARRGRTRAARAPFGFTG